MKDTKIKVMINPGGINNPKNIINPESIKKDFPIFSSKINGKELVYLDNSATTQKPKIVIDSIVNFYTSQNANVHRGVHTLSEIASLEFEEAHYTVAEFIGANASEIVFTSGTTHSLNILSRALTKSLEKGEFVKEESSGYEVVESEDMKREKEEAELKEDKE